MFGLEEGKVTPGRYARNLAKETVGLGAAQRMYDKMLESPMYGKSEEFLGSVQAGIGQVLFPIFSADVLSDPLKRDLEEFSHLEQVKFWSLLATTVALDVSIDAIAIIMAVKGSINTAIAIKLGHNLLAPVIADKAKPLLSNVVFQKNGPNSL